VLRAFPQIDSMLARIELVEVTFPPTS